MVNKVVYRLYTVSQRLLFVDCNKDQSLQPLASDQHRRTNVMAPVLPRCCSRIQPRGDVATWVAPSYCFIVSLNSNPTRTDSKSGMYDNWAWNPV